MDFMQDWGHFLYSQVTPSYLSTFHRVASNVNSVVSSLLDRASSGPDLASIALLLIILFVSLKLLDMLRRAVMFWITLALRIVWWGSIVLGGLYVWNRGVDGTVEDVHYWVEVWMGEYSHWKEQADVGRKVWEEQISAGRPGRPGRPGSKAKDRWY